MRRLLLALTLVLLIVSFEAATVAHAQRTSDPQKPLEMDHGLVATDRFHYGILANVHNVFINVTSYPSVFEFDGQALLPAPLKRENLERLLITLYTTRFSSNPKHIAEGPRKWPLYGLTDPPITLINRKNLDDHRDLMNQDATLTAVLQVAVQPHQQDPSHPHLGEIISLNLIQYRSRPEGPWPMLTYPFAVRTDLSDAEMTKQIEDYLSTNIMK